MLREVAQRSAPVHVYVRPLEMHFLAFFGHLGVDTSRELCLLPTALSLVRHTCLATVRHGYPSIVTVNIGFRYAYKLLRLETIDWM